MKAWIAKNLDESLYLFLDKPERYKVSDRIEWRNSKNLEIGLELPKDSYNISSDHPYEVDVSIKKGEIFIENVNFMGDDFDWDEFIDYFPEEEKVS